MKINKLLLGLMFIVYLVQMPLSTHCVAQRTYTLAEIKEKGLVWLAGLIFKSPLYELYYAKEGFFERVMCRTTDTHNDNPYKNKNDDK